MVLVERLQLLFLTPEAWRTGGPESPLAAARVLLL